MQGGTNKKARRLFYTFSNTQCHHGIKNASKVKWHVNESTLCLSFLIGLQGGR